MMHASFISEDIYHDTVPDVILMGYRHTFIAVFAFLALVGCDPEREERPCLNMGNPSPLVSGAAIVRIDVYGANAHCDGSTASASAGAPEVSRSFGAGQK